jgi:endonuclease/exonuclease/phosphatase family metal-dependent hydrolase
MPTPPRNLVGTGRSAHPRRGLRLATWNLHGGRPALGAADLKAVAAVLGGLEADVAGLQEVHRLLPPPGVFQDQPRRLARLLGGFVTFRRSFGVGRWGYGNAALSREPARRVRRVPLPSGREPRALLECDFGPGPAGAPFRLWVVHLGLSAAERERQVAFLRARAGAAELPLLVAGDLNAEPDGPELAALAAAGLRSAVPAECLTFPAGRPERRLDYLLHSPEWEPGEWGCPVTTASDHLPLWVDLRLRSAAGHDEA